MKLNKVSRILFSVFVVTALLSIASCSGDPKERTANDALSSLVASNKNISVFGHVSVYNVLKKANYKRIPKINVIIDAQVSSWKSAFELEGPTYFAVEGPISNDGNPKAVYAIMDIKGADSVVAKIHELGFSTEKAGDITYFQDGDVTCGVRNKIFVLVSKGGNYDGKKAIKDAFKATEGDLSEDVPHEIITKESDLVVGLSLERLYTTSNTSLSQLSASKKEELKELLEEGYIETSVNFKKGEITIESRNLFSDDLKERLWFNDQEDASLVKKMGKGKPWMGVSANFDMKKLTQFATDFSPGGMNDITKAFGPEMGTMMMFSGLNVATSLSGQFGLVATGNPKAEGSEFEFNAFLGLDPKATGMNMLIQSLFAGSPKKNGAYVIDNMAIKAKKDGIYAYGIKNKAKGPLVLPSCASNFGKSTFSAFINFGAMNVKSLELPEEYKFLEIVDCVSLDVNSDGSMLRITAKDKSKNMLDQITNFYYKSFKEDLDMMM